MKNLIKNLLPMAASIFIFSACAPTVKIQAPDKPITINLNVKIEHEIRVKVDKQLDNLFRKNKDLF